MYDYIHRLTYIITAHVSRHSSLWQSVPVILTDYSVKARRSLHESRKFGDLLSPELRFGVASGVTLDILRLGGCFRELSLRDTVYN